MKNNKNSKLKSGLLLTAMSALVIVSSLSLSAFAQSTIESKKNVIITETEPPKTLDNKVILEEKHEEMVFPVDMSKEQAEPFIKAAIETLKDKNINISEKDYWISSKYINNDSKDIQIDWYPNSFDGIGPMNFVDDKIYTVYFTDVNLDKGTGKIQNAYIIQKGKAPYTINVKALNKIGEDF